MNSALLLTLIAPIGCPQESAELRIAAMDHGGVEATCAVSLPAGYDPDKRYPLVLDFHGAIDPSRRGAEVTRAAQWSRFVREAPYVVVGLNGRTRSWGTIKGARDDRAYARAALAAVLERYSIDRERVFLAGFSSGSDFLCRSAIASEKAYAGCLVVCPGPPSVVGLKGGGLLRARAKPFFFLCGEEDYVRKAGAWRAYLALAEAGGVAAYREAPATGHAFPPLVEYRRALAWLEARARGKRAGDALAEARAALARGDCLAAATALAGRKKGAGAELWARIEARGRAAVAAAEGVDAAKEAGGAYEAWWKVSTQFHPFPELAGRARRELAALEKRIPGRELYRMRRDWFRRRAKRAPPERDREGKGRGAELFAFDRYLSYEQIGAALRDLARRFPRRARLESMGRSVQGRELWVLSLSDFDSGAAGERPAVYLQAGLHGNEISTTMVALYAAWQLAANPEASRGTDRLLRAVTFYIAPSANPDALHHYLAEPHSYWRPRFNYRPHDADGLVDEDPYEDLDGDGQIGLMYVPDPKGRYVLRDGRLVIGQGAPRYRLAGTEGIDNDGDGKLNEDRPGGVDLNRNFPVGHVARRVFEGSTGPRPASEPETRAIIDFVSAHPNIALFLDYHNDGDCVFTWSGEEAGSDAALLAEGAARIAAALGYRPRPLKHAGAGLAIAWAYGALGIPAYLLELESTRGARETYLAARWGPAAFMAPRPFEHPQLGRILLGNDYTKLARRNLHPADLFWQVDRNWAWLKEEAARLPRLELVDPIFRFEAPGRFRLSGRCRNAGSYPANTARALSCGRATAIGIETRGDGRRDQMHLPLTALGAGEEQDFHLEIEASEELELRVTHPRAGTVALPVLSPRSPTRPIRRRYAIEPGYATPEQAVLADNGYYVKGVAARERGPAFELRHGGDELRVAVLLGEWRDRRHLVPREEFEKAFFSRGEYRGRSFTGQRVYGSVADFYAEMSYGRLAVRGKVFDWVELPGSYGEYRDASFGSPVLHQRLEAAVRARDGSAALEGYDGLVFVWAGNAVRRTSMLWPMRLTLRDRPALVAFKMSEIYRGEFAAIGVACHEMAHTFGVNDKYGLGASKKPLGPWCLICKGTHGHAPSGRHRPFHLCAWCKSVIGWVQPAVIDPHRPQKLALRPITLGPRECFRVLLQPDGSEYLLLENRAREGFFTDLPSPGLVILRVGPNDKPSAPQVRVELLPAHGLPPAGRSDPADLERVAWPQDGRTELVVGEVRLAAIRRADQVIYLEVGPTR